MPLGRKFVELRRLRSELHRSESELRLRTLSFRISLAILVLRFCGIAVAIWIGFHIYSIKLNLITGVLLRDADKIIVNQTLDWPNFLLAIIGFFLTWLVSSETLSWLDKIVTRIIDDKIKVITENKT